MFLSIPSPWTNITAGYTKNPKYWDSEVIDGKNYKLPFTDTVVKMIIRDTGTQLAALRTGKIDLMLRVNWKDVENLKESNPHLLWSPKIYTNAFMLALRMDTKPVTDIRVRRALNMAVNKKEIVDSFYGGHAEILNCPFPKTFTSVYTPLDKLPPSARELFIYNPEKAKKLLDEAGYPNGFTFKAQISTADPELLDIAAMVVAYLAKVGVKMELETMDYPSWLRGQYFTPRPLIQAIVDVMQPQPEQLIADPAFGTGGFLLAAYDYIKTHYSPLDRAQLDHLRYQALHGWEIVGSAARLCVMNLYLRGIGAEDKDSPIEVADSLIKSPGPNFHMVLTNPPFGKKSSVTYVNDEGDTKRENQTIVRDDFWTTASNKQLNFVQHVYNMLKIDGSAAIVVPDNVLFEGGAGGKDALDL